MMKAVLVVLSLFACCYCLENAESLENVELLEDGRAKKKKSPARLWAMLLILILSKVAIFKVVTFLFFLGFFQKLFSIAGLVLKYFLNRPKLTSAPGPVYGAPQDYNTVGYSYGPPEHEGFADHETLPALTDLGGSFNWLFNKP